MLLRASLYLRCGFHDLWKTVCELCLSQGFEQDTKSTESISFVLFYWEILTCSILDLGMVVHGCARQQGTLS